MRSNCISLLKGLNELLCCRINPLSAKFIKWSNTLKQFVGNLPTNCLSVFDHFSGLALKGLSKFHVIFMFLKTDVNILILKLDVNKFHVTHNMNSNLNDNS